MEILAATSNRHKLREIRKILKSRVTGRQSRVKEDGKTFEENAIKKVRSLKLKQGQIGLADDSGLMVDCLGGKPGVKSARFASPPTKENLCNKLLNKMRQATGDWRQATFVCVIAIAYPSGKVKTVRGECRGKIIYEMRGRHGFGYDPVFVPRGFRETFAEMSPAMKNRLSHRSRALRKVKI
jgi:XTP/dITP diphosphohydrolase